MTEAERRAALEDIAAEVRACNRCRLHETRTQAVPGEGHPSTEVVFVGEGPGFNEDRLGRPFVGRAGDLLVRHLGSVGWRRDEVFITNVVKCRPPENRDPGPDEIAACAPFLRRQLEVLDPALIVTLGRHSMARFMPGARISQAHGTVRPAEPDTGATDAMVFAMYHPAAALRSTDVERQSYDDMGRVPAALEDARRRRAERRQARTVAADATTRDSLSDATTRDSLLDATTRDSLSDATTRDSLSDAEISPPLLSDTRKVAGRSFPASEGPQSMPHNAPQPPPSESAELVASSVGTGSAISGAETTLVNHPRDIPGAIAASPQGSRAQSDSTDATDPENQLPLF